MYACIVESLCLVLGFSKVLALCHMQQEKVPCCSDSHPVRIQYLGSPILASSSLREKVAAPDKGYELNPVTLAP